MSTRPARDERALDALLVRLEPCGSELDNGFTSHAPMVVEALVALGRADAGAAWLDGYQPRILPRRPPGVPVAEAGWREALGASEREADWQARFAADIERRGWRATLAHWGARLAPGFAAAAAHGPIRTAHAARALGHSDTFVRRRELADALALWAATYQTLPGDPLLGSGAQSASEALRQVPRVPRERRRNGGAITTAVEALDHVPGFGASLVALDRARPLDALTRELAEGFAGVFLEQVRTPLQAIVFTHAITGVVAARRLAGCVDDATADRLVAYAWQLGCALVAAYAEAPTDASVPEPPPPDALVDAAVAHGDDHVIKLTEACLDLRAPGGGAVLLAAAVRAAQVIPPHSAVPATRATGSG